LHIAVTVSPVPKFDAVPVVRAKAVYDTEVADIAPVCCTTCVGVVRSVNWHIQPLDDGIVKDPVDTPFVGVNVKAGVPFKLPAVAPTNAEGFVIESHIWLLL
jgi:hypothetical protein